MAVPERPTDRARTPRPNGPRKTDAAPTRTGTNRASADRATPSGVTRRPTRTELEPRSRQRVVARPVADGEWSHSLTGELPAVPAALVDGDRDRAGADHLDDKDGKDGKDGKGGAFEDHRNGDDASNEGADEGEWATTDVLSRGDRRHDSRLPPDDGDLGIVARGAHPVAGLNGSVDVFSASNGVTELEPLPTGPVALIGPPTVRVPVIIGEALSAPPLALPAALASPTVEPVALSPAGAPRAAGPPKRFVLRRRGRVRRVSRVVRRVDAWSVLKISAILYALVYGILLVAGVLLWKVANETGTVANIEGFVRELFGLQTFKLNGKEIYRASWRLGALLVLAGTGVNVTAAVMFNLITDLVGGVRVTVLEEEVRVMDRRPRRRLRRRKAAAVPPASGNQEAG